MKVRKFTIVSLIAIILLAQLVFFLVKSNMNNKNKIDNLYIQKNIKYTATIKDSNFITYNQNKEQVTKIRAVRLSSVTPYYERNQTNISKSKVKEWLKIINEMNANTIIVPYIQSPSFYRAIYEYNLGNNPIYIIHEVEIDTKVTKTSYNLYDNKVYQDLYNRVIRTIDVVHGDTLLLDNRKSHTGLYMADVSNYVLGYIVGTDISQEIVAITNLENQDITKYDGKYFRVDNGTAYEVLLTKILNKAYTYELNKYQTSKLYSISTIVETDPFSHFNENNTIIHAMTNLNNIKSNNLFASIVAYPDALSYLELGNDSINDDYYYNYLKKYDEYYSIPIIVSNVGISTSRGVSNITYDNHYDRGGNSEEEQATKLLELLKVIDDSGINGVGINSFQDDWGQMTAFNMKNVIDINKNNYWQDMQSSDESFGLISFESGIVTIDGLNNDFNKVNTSYKDDNLKVKLTGDSKYLYLYLETSVTDESIYIGFDILKSIGSKEYKNRDFNITNDFVLELNKEDDTELFVNQRYDIFTYNNYFYDNVLGKQDNAPDKNTNEFNSIYLLNQRKFLIQSNAELIEGVYYNTGKLVYGCEKNNSLVDFFRKNDIIEMRISWNLININNPIDKIAQGDFYKTGNKVLANVTNIRLQIKSDSLKSSVIKYKLPNYKDTKYQEKLKKAYFSIKDYWKGMIK